MVQVGFSGWRYTGRCCGDRCPRAARPPGFRYSDQRGAGRCCGGRCPGGGRASPTGTRWRGWLVGLNLTHGPGVHGQTEPNPWLCRPHLACHTAMPGRLYQRVLRASICLLRQHGSAAQREGRVTPRGVARGHLYGASGTTHTGEAALWARSDPRSRRPCPGTCRSGASLPGNGGC